MRKSNSPSGILTGLPLSWNAIRLEQEFVDCCIECLCEREGDGEPLAVVACEEGIVGVPRLRFWFEEVTRCGGVFWPCRVEGLSRQGVC